MPAAVHSRVGSSLLGAFSSKIGHPFGCWIGGFFVGFFRGIQILRELAVVFASFDACGEYPEEYRM